jgi:hypothetical protein
MQIDTATMIEFCNRMDDVAVGVTFAVTKLSNGQARFDEVRPVSPTRSTNVDGKTDDQGAQGTSAARKPRTRMPPIAEKKKAAPKYRDVRSTRAQARAQAKKLVEAKKIVEQQTLFEERRLAAESKLANFKRVAAKQELAEQQRKLAEQPKQHTFEEEDYGDIVEEDSFDEVDYALSQQIGLCRDMLPDSDDEEDIDDEEDSVSK